MKNLRLILICFYTLIFFAICNGQGLKIMKDNSTRTLPQGNLVEIEFAKDFRNMDCENCSYSKVLGNIGKLTKDDIEIEVLEETTFERTTDLGIENKKIYNTAGQVVSIPKSDIYRIVNHKSPKRKKSKENLFTVGALLIFTGAASAAGSFFVTDKSDKRKTLLYGGTQIGLGIILMATNHEKRYNFGNSREKMWRFD